MLLKLISLWVLKLKGYQIQGLEFSKSLKKAVVIAGGHTSNWDFFYALGFFHALGMPMSFTIKHEWTKIPIIGAFIKSLGGQGIDRSKAKNTGRSMVQELSQLFEGRDRFYLTVTPEATRSLNPRWKTGFYHIAMRAQVPIVIGFIDYKEKKCGFLDVFHPTGDLEKDMVAIKKYYLGVTPKYPANFTTGLTEEQKII